MDIIWKVIGGSMVALVFGVILGKRNPDAAVVLNLLVCAMLLSVALGFLYPLLDFVPGKRRRGMRCCSHPPARVGECLKIMRNVERSLNN